jgi:glycosyltransferase involved in cell wall biosynthesis
MDQRLPLSVSLITLNEEANLRRCLESVRGLASQIIVLDSGSQDRTVAVAREFGAGVQAAPWNGFLAHKNGSLQLCSQPWVLCLDADEALTPELARAVRQALEADDPSISGFELNRRTFYLGDWIWHAWYPEWRLRLVRRAVASWTGLDPHPALRVPGLTRRLEGDLLHYSFRDLQDHLQRSLRYAQTTAASYAAQGRRFHWTQLWLSPGVAFLKHLVLRQGWRDGWRGWLIAGIKGLDTFAKYAFLLERERGIPQPAKRSET